MTDGDGGEPPVVAVALHPGPGPHRVGIPVRVRVEVSNIGNIPVWMPGVLDGSEAGTRLPLYRPAVSSGDEVVASPALPEDPLVSPLRPEDFRRLGPGESFDPTDRSAGAACLPLFTFEHYRPDRPGRYRYSLHLDTTGSEQRWMGHFGQEPYRDRVLRLLAEVPRVSLIAEVHVEVGG
jgi:hypothetical protein